MRPLNLSDVLQLTRPLILFDLETTAKKPEVARIVQIGYTLFKPNLPPVRWHSLIDPLVEIPKASSEVHGITDEIIRFGCAKCRKRAEEHPVVVDAADDGYTQKLTVCAEWKQAPPFKAVGPALHRGFTGCDLAGYNVNFDIDVMDFQLQRECNLRLSTEGIYVIDSYRVWQVLEPRSLSDAVATFGEEGVKLDNAHDAMADVNGTEIALIGQLTRHKNSHTLPRTVPELLKHLWPDRIDAMGKFCFNSYDEVCFGFGKHKDEPVALHMDYIKWMKRQGNWSAEVTVLMDGMLAGRFPQRKKHGESIPGSELDFPNGGNEPQQGSETHAQENVEAQPAGHDAPQPASVEEAPGVSGGNPAADGESNQRAPSPDDQPF
jgi:DNA polymerase-3 subunit epsilon